MILNPLERWFVNSPMRKAMQTLVVRWFNAVLPLHPGAEILEIGCGAGAGARLLARQFKPQRLLLTDLDLRMVRLAQRSLSATPLARTYCCVGDAADLPFRSASADAVFGFGFLHHVPAWREGLAEIWRVLRPGGIYYMEEYYPSLYQNIIPRRLTTHPEHDRFGSRDLRQEFARLGLDLRYTFELRRFGMLGVAMKRAVPL